MYIIKKHYEATENNPNFAGVIKDYYEGKAGHLIGSNGFTTDWEINEYGYKTLSAAKRGLKKAVELANWETEKGYWTVTAELVEV
jgi:hypothetical protein